MAVVVKDRTCRQCGALFQGGPRAWYCPSCRAERKKEATRRYKKKEHPDRPIGSVDKCVICGKEYTVNSARQKYCPDCAHEAVRVIDRQQSIRWNQENRDTYYAGRNEKRRAKRFCVICGAPITAKTVTITCENPACKLERKRQRQAASDARRNGKEPPADYKPTRISHPKTK